MAKIADLKLKTDDELSGQLGELKREAFNLRFQAATNQLEKPSRVRVVRRTIAQIKTLQTMPWSGLQFAGQSLDRPMFRPSASRALPNCP